MSFQKIYGLRGPSGLNMVNQAFIIIIAYREEKKKENTRDRSVPDGSVKYKICQVKDMIWWPLVDTSPGH